MQLPIEVRDSLVLLLDEYFENVNDTPDAAELAAFVVLRLQEVAEEAGVEEADEILDNVVENAEFEEPLVVVLQEEFTSNSDELDLTGEDVVTFVASACNLTWDEEDELEDDFEELDGDELLDEDY